MPRRKEVEIKFWIENLPAVRRKLKVSGFHCVTPRTHEFNTLYDLPGLVLRGRGELLRLRKYGTIWTLTHKAPGSAKSYKSRIETETQVSDGPAMAAILASLGFRTTFEYEKFRAEWSDGVGQVVLDETPLGILGEIEGTSAWIDKTARILEIDRASYVTASYAELFFEWKRRTKHSADFMTFAAVGTAAAKL